MSKRTKVPRTVAAREPAYPTLREHLATRRRFLGVAGVVAAGGLASACHRGLGAGGDADGGTAPDAAPLPDAHVWNDASVELPGAVEYPDYYTVRIPAEGDLSAYLIDEGHALFYVIAATEVPETQQTLLEALVAAGDACRDVVAEYTYDALSTGPGVLACEGDLLEALDQLVMDLDGHADPTVAAVTLHLSLLEPGVGMAGVPPEMPSYP